MRKIHTKTKLVYGVGINDADYAVQVMGKDGKIERCPFYKTWMSMLMRVYSPKYHALKPTYIGTTVCKEWLTFSTFKTWMKDLDWEGNQIDKDIMIPGNLHYSPATCIFVSPQLNKLLNNHAADRGEHPVGVSFNRKINKHQAQIRYKGKTKYLGRFNTPQEAAAVYAKAKSRHIRGIAFKQTNPRICNGLLKHAALIGAGA